MPAAIITDSGNTPAVPSSELLDATTVFLQNNSDTDFWYRLGKAVSSSGANLGLVLKGYGGSTVITGPAAKLPVYAMHGAAGESKTLTWDKLSV